MSTTRIFGYTVEVSKEESLKKNAGTYTLASEDTVSLDELREQLAKLGAAPSLVKNNQFTLGESWLVGTYTETSKILLSVRAALNLAAACNKRS